MPTNKSKPGITKGRAHSRANFTEDQVKQAEACIINALKHEDANIQLKAAGMILDRMFGKSIQNVDLTVGLTDTLLEVLENKAGRESERKRKVIDTTAREIDALGGTFEDEDPAAQNQPVDARADPKTRKAGQPRRFV